MNPPIIYRALFLLLFVPALACATTTAPASQPAPNSAPNSTADSATDWLLGSATTAPAAPTSQPDLTPTPAPLISKDQTDPDRRHGTITLSNGTIIHADISTTPDKPLRTWDEEAGEYRDMPMRFVKSIKAQVLWEQDEPEWRFKESGSDIKINTGRTYPSRETAYILTLKNGKTIKGAIVAPLYTTDDNGQEKTYILHKRDKGDIGQSLKDLVYVSEVTFDDPK
jgi:hypothetical protein